MRRNTLIPPVDFAIRALYSDGKGVEGTYRILDVQSSLSVGRLRSDRANTESSI
jgi:hypothetical protein